MKKQIIILMTMAVAVVMGFFSVASAADSVPVKKIIHGKEGMTIIRSFSDWHNVNPNPSLRHIERFNSWAGTWETIPEEGWESLEGVYKMEFVYTNSYEIEGFSGPCVQTSFQTISLDSLLNSFSEDPVKLLQKINKISKENATKSRFLSFWMAYSSEGLSVADTDYARDGIEDYEIIAIIPCNSNGFVDISNISQGDRGISLSDEVPHFLILKPLE